MTALSKELKPLIDRMERWASGVASESHREQQEEARLWGLDNPTVSQRLQSYAALVEEQMLRRVWEAAGGDEADFPLSDTHNAVLALVRSLRRANYAVSPTGDEVP